MENSVYRVFGENISVTVKNKKKNHVAQYVRFKMYSQLNSW